MDQLTHVHWPNGIYRDWPPESVALIADHELVDLRPVEGEVCARTAADLEHPPAERCELTRAVGAAILARPMTTMSS